MYDASFPFESKFTRLGCRLNHKQLSKESGRIGGQRPRPRVALLGTFGADDVAHFQYIFPTVWRADNISRLEELVDVREIDLIVIASGVTSAGNWPREAHCVCFSRHIERLPGPLTNTYMKILGAADTEEFRFPEALLPVSRRREADYGSLTSVRGWPRLDLDYPAFMVGATEVETATTIFNSGAIISEHHTNSPLAIAFLREDTGLGVGWLPSVDRNQSAWVDLLVAQWAQSDKRAFPSYGDWTNSPEWMVPQEMQILSQIQAFEQKKREFVINIDKQIGELTAELALAKTNANKGLRRLITTQGKELVDEVAKALKSIGFNVVQVDELVGEKRPKREDLRLEHLTKGGEQWNAIVEVRGYARSGGTTTDLHRLARFAELYMKETGKAPNKRIYVVNGEVELPPSQRQEPLASATEDLQIFSESDGLLIWSIDLFRALKATNPTDYPALLESIKCAKGRWIPAKTLTPIIAEIEP